MSMRVYSDDDVIGMEVSPSGVLDLLAAGLIVKIPGRPTDWNVAPNATWDEVETLLETGAVPDRPEPPDPDATFHELVCPDCGGRLEERGHVRFYRPVRVTLDTQAGLRRVEDDDTAGWSTPIETLELDDPPYHCLECDQQHAIHALRVPS